MRAMFYTGASSFSGFGIRIVTTAILARMVLPEHFGLVMMITAITAIADQLREMGLSSATIQRKDISHEEVSNLFWLNVGVGVLVGLVMCASAPLISAYYREPRLTAITQVLSLNFVFGGLLVQHQALLTRQLKLGYTSLIRVVVTLISTLIAIGLAAQNYGYWSLVWREVIQSGLLAVGMWICCRWVPSLPSLHTNIRNLVGFGVNLTAANIVGTIASAADRFLIGRFWGPGPVGVYRQAFQLISSPTDQLLSPLYQVTQPALSLLQSDARRYAGFYCKVLKVVCSLTMPLSVFVAIYSDEVTLLLLGPKWMEAAPIVMIISIGTFIKQAIGSTAFIPVSRGDSRTYLTLTVLRNVVAVIAMCVGVQWGIKGVAIAEVITIYLLIVPTLRLNLRGSPVTFRAFITTLARPAVCSLAVAAALMICQSSALALNSFASLTLGCFAALLTFVIAWVVIPGGINELKTIVVDLRSAKRQKEIIVAVPEPLSTK